MMTASPPGYDLNQINTRDSRELIKAIPARSIDLVCYDPLYLKEHHATEIARQRLTQVQKLLLGLDSEHHLLGLEVLV